MVTFVVVWIDCNLVRISNEKFVFPHFIGADVFLFWMC
jgi:hypothetical protein